MNRFSGIALVWLALMGIAAGDERHFVWNSKAGARAADHRKELAQVRLRIDVDGKLTEASKAIEDLHVRAATALDYEGRMGVLVDVAKLRAELFTALGRKDEALRAASVLLLDESARKAAANYELVLADEKTLAQETQALEDAGLVELRKKLSTRSVPDQLPPPGDEIEAAVYLALSEKRPQVVYDIGQRAVPTLEKIVSFKPDEFPADFEQDPLGILIGIARLRGGQLVLDHLDAGGFFWKKRTLRAMTKCDVIRANETVDPVWLAILGKLLGDPQVGRESLPLVRIVVERDALTPELTKGLVRALDSNDPDLAKDVMTVLGEGCGKTVKPVIATLLRHPNETVRRAAAERMFCWSSSDEFLACVDHEDLVMRKQLARFLHRTHVAPNGNTIAARIQEGERTVLARLAVDPDPSVRSEAVEAIHGLKTPLAPEVYERLAADGDADVLAQVDYLLLALLRTPENRAPWFFTVLGKRRANPALPMGRNFNESEKASLCRNLLETDVGVPLVFRWALEERDDKMLEIAAANVRSQPERVLDLPASAKNAEPANPKGVFLLDDATLEKTYRRTYGVASEAFKHLNEGLAHPWWGSKVRAGAVLPVLLDASAPRELRVAAASIAAMRGGDAVIEGIEKLLADPSWSTAEPGDLERRSLGKILDGLPRADRTRVALYAIRTKAIPDAVASAFLIGFQDPEAFPAEAARPALDRWLDATAEQLTDPWIQVLWSAIRKLPAQAPDETVARYLVRALEMGPTLSQTSLQKISELRWPAFLEVLGKRVRACDFAVVGTLGAYMDDRAAELLLEAMGSCPNEEFRKACLGALDSIRKYQDEKAHWAARKNGQQARDEAVAKLLPMLADADEKIRAQAVLSLATLDAVEHLPKLVEMMKDKSPAVREAAGRALEKLNGGDGKKP